MVGGINQKLGMNIYTHTANKRQIGNKDLL